MPLHTDPQVCAPRVHSDDKPNLMLCVGRTEGLTRESILAASDAEQPFAAILLRGK